MAQTVRAIVTDIEGTTSALTFVRDVLFPYARERLSAYVKKHADRPDVRDALEEVRHIENNPVLSTDEIIQILLCWSAEDRKIKPLKAIQGMIWEEGYKAGAFTSHMYDDAVIKLKEWHAEGVPLYIYSSGSVQAQKLLFGHTKHGDLTPLFSGYFDTAIGGKLEPESYAKIAAETGHTAKTILFLSDHAGELDAARKAGLLTVLVDRDGMQHDGKQHKRVDTFSTITPAEIA